MTVGRILRAPIETWTYRSLAYLLLAFPLGVGYFVVLTMGIALTFGLSITLFGPIMLVVTLLAVVALAWFDGHLTGVILDVEVTPMLPSTDDGLVTFLKELFVRRDTWLGALFLGWKIVLGFVGFIVLVIGITLATTLVLLPLFYGDHVVVEYGVGSYPINTITRALVGASAGLAIGYLTLVAVSATGFLSASIAERIFAPEPNQAASAASDDPQSK